MGSIAEYYDLETVKLVADANRVALFTTHPGTLGAYREARLREYLKDHVAGRFSIADGFISDRDDISDNISDRSSKQIDCLVYDQTDRAALIETDSFVCVEPEHATAFVEVKSTLGISREYAPNRAGPSSQHPFNHKGRGYRWTGTLVDALLNIASAIQVMTDAGIEREAFFAGILSYAGNKMLLLDQAVTSGGLVQQLGLRSLDDLPDCICCLTSGWWSFEAYAWNDIDPEWDEATYNAAESVLIKVVGGGLLGAPLQLFTSYLSGKIDDRTVGGRPRIGGLRSAAGRSFTTANMRFALPSPGRG